MTATTVIAAPKRRPRRIAADEAHAWARDLRLGNSLAKLTLSMLSGYVNGDGICFAGIEALSEDTELSPDTVRKRLAWLEQIGAIARFPQWIDANGRRNGDGHGKRTSDEIRLLIHADPDEIEARAKGNGDVGSEAAAPAVSPRCQQGLMGAPKDGQDSVSPLVAPDQPSDCGEGLISEPEPEKKDSPQPPKGGGQATDQELEADISEFARNYPAPITNMPRLRTVLAAIPRPPRRRIATTAAKGYASYIRECEQKKKPRAVKDADRWVASGMWEGYVAAGERSEASARRTNVELDSQAGKAWATLHRIAHVHPFEAGGFYLLPDTPSARLLALAGAPLEQDWTFIEPEQSNQCGAWDEFVRECLQGKPRPPLVTERNPGGRRGFYAPWAWPPRVDGSLTATGPPDHKLSEEDAGALSK